MKTIFSWTNNLKNSSLIYGLFIIGTTILLGYNLNGLLPGGSVQELEVVRITEGWPAILENMIWWPYYLLVKLARFLISDGILAARLVSLGLAIIAASSFLTISRRYWNMPVALLGTGLFIGNSWFIQMARVGAPEMFGISLILGFWLLYLNWQKQNGNQALFGGLIFLGLLALFVPLLVWFVIVALVFILTRQKISRIVITRNWQGLLAAVGLAAATLLVLGLSQDKDQILSLFGIQSPLPNLGQILQASLEVMGSLIWQTPANPSRWLANLPILDAFGVVMLAIGVYHFLKTLSPSSRGFSFSIGLIAIIILGFSGGALSSTFALVLPFLALLIVGGIKELFRIWKQTFPTNPLAEGLVVIVFIGLVGLSVSYQTQRYFVAWAKAPATKEIYSANIKQ